MKQKLITLILLNGLLVPSFFAHAQNFPPLTCTRVIVDKKNPPPVWTPVAGDAKAEGHLLFEPNTQAQILAAELNFYLDQTLTPALQNNTHNVNNLMDEVIYRTRETHLCMREICENFSMICKNQSENSINECIQLKGKCENDVEHFFIPGPGNKFPLIMTLNRITMLENQERKDRTALYEKFQGFFVRMGQYTIPLIIKSNSLFQGIVNKVTKTLMKPN